MELAAATQHADDDPSPTPDGISDLMEIFSPDFELNSLRIFWAINTIGLNLESMVLIDSSFDVLIVPISEIISMVLALTISDSTVILLSIEERIAFPPYTIKCSPNKITFAGADAIDFN